MWRFTESDTVSPELSDSPASVYSQWTFTLITAASLRLLLSLFALRKIMLFGLSNAIFISLFSHSLILHLTLTCAQAVHGKVTQGTKHKFDDFRFDLKLSEKDLKLT